MGAMAIVLDQPVEPGTVDLDLGVRAVVDCDAQTARAFGGGKRSAAFVLDVKGVTVLDRPGTTFEWHEFLARRWHFGPGFIGGPDRSHQGRQLGQILERCLERFLNRLLGPLVVTFAEVKPAQNSTSTPEKEAGPPLTSVACPEKLPIVDQNGELDPEPAQSKLGCLRVGAKGKPRCLDAKDPQAERFVASLPLDQVGQGADAVQLAVVQEMNQHRSLGRQDRHLAGVLADPGGLGRQLGCCDVISKRVDELIVWI